MYSFVPTFFLHNVFWDSSCLCVSTIHSRLLLNSIPFYKQNSTHLFIYSPVGEHLDCFQAEAIMSMGVEIFFKPTLTRISASVISLKLPLSGSPVSVHVDNSSDRFSALIFFEVPVVLDANDQAPRNIHLGLPHSLPSSLTTLQFPLLAFSHSFTFTCWHLSPEISLLPIFLPSSLPWWFHPVLLFEIPRCWWFLSVYLQPSVSHCRLYPAAYMTCLLRCLLGIWNLTCSKTVFLIFPKPRSCYLSVPHFMEFLLSLAQARKLKVILDLSSQLHILVG